MLGGFVGATATATAATGGRLGFFSSAVRMLLTSVSVVGYPPASATTLPQGSTAYVHKYVRPNGVFQERKHMR